MKCIGVIFALLTVSGIMAQTPAFMATEKAIEDINYMVLSIEEIHYNPYFKINKAEFHRYKDEIISTFDKDSIPLKLFIAAGMKLSAQLSGGHTVMDWQNNQVIPELVNERFIPFTGELSSSNGTFRVSRSMHPDIKKGDEVKAINGIRIEKLYKECMTFWGGIESFKMASCEKVFPLYLFFTNQLKHPYHIKLANNYIRTAGLNVSELNQFLNENNTRENYTFDILENNIGLITYNSCTDYDAFKLFLKQVFKDVREQKIQKLIIDIRENSGGDSELNDLLLSYITSIPYRQSYGRYWKVSRQAKEAFKANQYETIFGSDFMNLYYESENGAILETFDEGLMQPQKPENYFSGKTCFLIGPNTFSSANFLADAVKTYKLSTLIGTGTGEWTNDFGELIHFVLPNSGNYVYVSSTYDIGANGNPDVFQAVLPDIPIKENALQFAIKWIQQEK